jgi:subtilisin family serine protease
LCIALAGCGGGGGANTETTDSNLAQPNNWISASVADSFDAVLAAQIRSSSRFQGVDANVEGGGSNQSHPYELARLDLVLSGGWTGAGQRVAVVDDGFRITHQEFAGTDIAANGNIAVAGGSGHGTHVAALITGSDDQGSMMGFAPDADLHLTSYLHDDSRTGIDLGKLALATAQAASMDAVAQNNSWGVLHTPPGETARELLVSDVRDHMSAHGSNVPEAFASLTGGTQSAWSTYFNELDAFQSSGVIVWAMSNDSDLPVDGNDASSALPLLVPELREAWIAVGNGLFETNSANEITRAERLSAACGEMASRCLFADGTTRSASAASDTSYGQATGTSFAAPQVSGAIAIMAQAFPSLSAQEWTRRLLATAYSDFADFTQGGTVNFGDDVVKAYSDEWGMGVLDIAAALSPVDDVSLVNGRTLEGAERTTVSNAALVSGAAYGDATRAALSGMGIAVFDKLDTPFLMSAETLAVVPDSTGRPHPLPLFGDSTAIEALAVKGEDRQSVQTSFGANTYRLDTATLGGAGLVSSYRGLSSPAAATGALATLSGHGAAMVGQIQAGPLTVEHYGLVAKHSTISESAVGGIGAALGLDLGPLAIKASTLTAHEQGGVLGLSGYGPMGVPTGAAINTTALSAQLEVGAAGVVFAGVETGTAAAGSGTGYVTGMENPTFSAFQIGVATSSILGPSDQLTIAVSQPLRLETGALELTMPAGRTRDGGLITADHRAELVPAGRQIDLGLHYQVSLEAGSELEFGAVLSHDAGHIQGSTHAVFGAQFRARF